MNDIQDCFAIIVQYDEHEEEPERIFKGIADLIGAFKTLDNELVRCIDGDIGHGILLEDVQHGSIKVILRNFVSALPDEGLREGDVKKVIGNFLLKAKYKILEFLSDKDSLESEKDVQSIEEAIGEMAAETNVNTLGCYTRPSRYGLLQGVNELSEAYGSFKDTEHIYVQSQDGDKLAVNHHFNLSKEQIGELCKGDVLDNNATVILQIKRPDFLGDTQWEFRHGDTKLSAKIEDKEWLAKYRMATIKVFPGDSLKVTLHTTTVYSKSNELLSEKNIITKVIGVLHPDHYTPIPLIK